MALIFFEAVQKQTMQLAKSNLKEKYNPNISKNTSLDDQRVVSSAPITILQILIINIEQENVGPKMSLEEHQH